MFESLSDRLGSVVSKLRNRGQLSEADVDEILVEIRTALLGAEI
jgi:signal recognition particle subunit SRP54